MPEEKKKYFTNNVLSNKIAAKKATKGKKPDRSNLSADVDADLNKIPKAPSVLGNKPAPTQYQADQGQPFQLPNQYENFQNTDKQTQTDSKSSTTDKTSGWDVAKTGVMSAIEQLKEEDAAKKAEIGQFKASYPEESTISGRYGQRQDAANKYQTKVDHILDLMTGQLKMNNQNEFFEKIIDAFGQGIAGAIGLDQNAPVSDFYKPVDLFDRPAEDEAAKVTAERNLKENSINFDKQLMPMEKAVGEMDKKDADIRERTGQINALASAGRLENNRQTEKTGSVTGTSSTQQQGGGYKEQVVVPPYKPQPKVGAGGKGGTEFVPDTDSYNRALATAKNQYNQVEARLKSVKSNNEFINQLAQALNTWGRAGGASITANPSLIGQRFMELSNRFGNDSAKVRERMLAELAEGLNSVYSSSNYTDIQDAIRTWAVYGLPSHMIKMKKAGQGGFPIAPSGSTPGMGNVPVRPKVIPGKQTQAPAQAPTQKPAPVAPGGKTYRVVRSNGVVYPRVPANRLEAIKKQDPNAQITENP